MKFFNYAFLVVGCLAAATGLAAAQNCGTTQTLTVGTQFGVPPFETLNLAGVPTGFDVALACQLRERLGFRDIQFVPVDPTDPNVFTSGQIAIVMSALSEINPFSTTEPNIALVKYADFAYALLYNNAVPGGTTPANALSTLAGETVGVLANSFEAQVIGNLVPPVIAKPLVDVAEALAELKAGTIKAFFASNAIVNNANLSNLGVAPLFDVVLPANNQALDPFRSTGLGIAVSPSCCQLYTNIQKAISDMVADGTYAALARQFGLNPTFVPSTVNLTPPACATTTADLPVRNEIATFLFRKFCPCVPTVVPTATSGARTAGK